MAKKDEFRDVYWVRLLERQQNGIRQQQELHRFESSAGALKKFEELVLENEGREGEWIVDVSYKDVKTLLRKVEEDLTQASSGNKMLGIKISADYVLSQKINLQLFYDHQGTTPLISSSYPVKSDNVGVNIKLMLTRDSK